MKNIFLITLFLFLINFSLLGQVSTTSRMDIQFVSKDRNKMIFITRYYNTWCFNIKYIDPKYPSSDSIKDSNQKYHDIQYHRGSATDTSCVFFKLNDKSVKFQDLLKYDKLEYVDDIKYIDGIHGCSKKERKILGTMEINIIIKKRTLKKQGFNLE